ncbi:MAG: PEP-CTERM sorting domain-containing protein [Armatimonadetes bacterium]|nr:PEP-CTERM sorting domain-containing protein [Armatimonadota bacterium]
MYPQEWRGRAVLNAAPVVPEPSSLALLGLALPALCLMVRRRVCRNGDDHGMVAQGQRERIDPVRGLDRGRPDRRVVNLHRGVRAAQVDGDRVRALDQLTPHDQIERAVALL